MPDLEQQHRKIELVEIARKVCAELSVAFSVNDANQALADMISAPLGSSYAGDDGAGDDWEEAHSTPSDAAILNAVGRAAGVRFREVTSGVREMTLGAFEAAPIVVTRKPVTDQEESSYFVVLRRYSRSRFVVFIDGREQVVSTRWLRHSAKQNENGNCHWFLAQPVLAAEMASSFHYQTGTQQKPLTPLKRLLAFLRPEARDMRTVAIFAVFVGILSLTTPLAVEALVNTVAFGRYLQPLIMLSLIVFIFLAIRAGFSVLMTIVVEIMQRRLFVRVVDDLAFRLTRVPLVYLKSHHGPELVNRFFDIVNVQKVTSKLLLESLLLVLQTIIGLTMIAFYHPFLLGYDVALITMMILMLWAMGRGAVKTSKIESGYKYETAAWLQEIVRHPTTFKFNGGLGFAINRADELAANYVQARMDHFHILVRQIGFSMLMQAVAATALLGLGGYLVIEQQLTIGQLVAAELIITVILGSFAKIGKDLESFYDLLASVDKLGKLFDLPVEPADRLQMAGHDGATRIELVDLKFLKASSSKINATIEAGSTAAITGPSGSGKTKAIETIAGLHSPEDGYVLVDDFRVDLIGSESLQSQLAFINNIEIFDGTVDENLRLGRKVIDSQRINETIENMGLQKTITGLDGGYLTRLSVTGFPLSSTQAIRLVLARALIARPGALLVDGLLDRLPDDELDDVLQRLDHYTGDTTIVIATGRRVIANWAQQLVKL